MPPLRGRGYEGGGVLVHFTQTDPSCGFSRCAGRPGAVRRGSGRLPPALGLGFAFQISAERVSVFLLDQVVDGF